MENRWTTREETTAKVRTGWGSHVELQVGENFVEALKSAAREANYGDYFRVFLNGQEIIDPSDAPNTVELGMEISITAYDKVG